MWLQAVIGQSSFISLYDFCNSLFSLKIFLMWTIFEVFIESVTILLLFYVFVFWP